MRLGCVCERRWTAGSRYNNVLHDIFRWPEDEYVSRTHERTHVRTHSRHCIYSSVWLTTKRRGSSNPSLAPSFSFSLFLPFFASLSVSSLATVVATQQAGFQTNKAVREKNARFSTVQFNIRHAVIKTKCSRHELRRETACSYIFIKY